MVAGRDGDHKAFMIDPTKRTDRKHMWGVDFVTDPALYRVIPVKGVAPHAHSGKLCPGVLIVAAEPLAPLETLAATRAFRTMTVPWLSKLFTAADVVYEGRKPTTEKPLLFALIKHYRPADSKEQVDEIIANRCVVSADAAELASAVSDPAVASVVSALVEEQEHADVVEPSMKAPKAKAKAAPIVPFLAPVGAAAAGSGGVATPDLLPVDHPASVTPEWARLYIPKAKVFVKQMGRIHVSVFVFGDFDSGRIV